MCPRGLTGPPAVTLTKYRIAGNFHGRKFSRFKGKTFCDFYFRDFKWDDLWICVGINYCGFYFRDSVYSPRNRENKKPAKISRYTVVEIRKETSTKLYTPFLIGLNLQYGPYAYFGYWTLISDPEPNMKSKKLKSNDQRVPNQAEAKRDSVINPHNYNFNQF